jgi:capsular polysaccharide biosynthesis protein
MSGQFFHGFDPGEAERWLAKIVRTPDPSQPPICHLTDAVALPGIPGLHRPDGHRIAEAAARSVSPDAPLIRREKLYKGAPDIVEVPDTLEVVEQPVLFCGHLMKHYGHFVIESMSRLWARQMFPNLPILFTSPRKWRDPPPYGNDVIDALGLRERLQLVSRPTLYRHVVSPAPAIEYRWKAYSVADEPHVAVASALESRGSRRAWRNPVYLTRSGLPDTLRKSGAEPELEAELAKRGFDVVRPEELTLQEQIGLFERAPLVVGTLGSALHTALFARTGATLGILNWGRGFEHYLLVDAVKRHTAHYIKSVHRRLEDEVYVIDVPLTLQLLERAGLVDAKGRTQSPLNSLGSSRIRFPL